MTRDIERLTERQEELHKLYKFGELYDGVGGLNPDASDVEVVQRARALVRDKLAFTHHDVDTLLCILDTVETLRDHYKRERNEARDSLNESVRVYNEMVGGAAVPLGYAVVHADVMMPGVFGTKEQAEYHRSTTMGSAGTVCKLVEDK